MSRSGYGEYDPQDTYDVLAQGRWVAMLRSALRGKRGRKFLTDLRDALDALPVKRLIHSELVTADGNVCAIGSVGVRRGVDMSPLLRPADCDPDEWAENWECEANERAEALGSMFDIAPCLAQEVMYQNDEASYHNETPEQRWIRVRKWVAKKLGEEWVPPGSAAWAQSQERGSE